MNRPSLVAEWIATLHDALCAPPRRQVIRTALAAYAALELTIQERHDAAGSAGHCRVCGCTDLDCSACVDRTCAGSSTLILL